ncbi:MAG: beta strand repeat-containing protein, partial [Gemmatimonadales bacterium]
MRPRPGLFGLLVLVALAGSCVGGDRATGPDVAELSLTLQPALIPSAADASALPIHRIRAVVARQLDGAVLREQRQDVSPTAPSWTLEVSVPVGSQSTTVVVYLYLLNVGSDGTETVQFSGRTAPLSISSGTRLADVAADVVRGPLSNLSVTGVTITSSPDTLYVGGTSNLSAIVTSSAPTPVQVFWTSLDPTVVGVIDSTATGIAAGTAQIVASAGAHADTTGVVVIVPAVDSVRVSPDSADVAVAGTRTYTAQLFDANGGPITGRPITWTTGNGSIATVSPSGVVTGVAAGTTTVRATSEGVFDEAVVRVTSAPNPGGATNTWIAGSGNWSNPAKWTLGRVPIATDTVRLTQGVDYLVTLDANATVAKLVIGGTADAINLRVTGATLTITGTVNGPELELLPLGGLEIEDANLVVSGISNAGSVRTNGVVTIDADSVRSTGAWSAQSGVQVLGATTGVWFEANGQLEVASASALQMGPGSELHFAPDGSASVDGTGGVLVLGNGSTLRLFQTLSIDGPSLVLMGTAVVQEESEDLVIGPSSIVQLLSETGAVDVDVNVIVGGALTASGTDTRVANLDVVPGGSVILSGTGASDAFATTTLSNGGDVVIEGAGLTVTANEITNQSGATLTTASVGTVSVLDAQLINDGSMVVASETHLRRTDGSGTPISASHVNAGTIDIIQTGKLVVELGGTAPSITNSGTISLEDPTAVLAVENLAAPGVGQIHNTASGVLTGVGTVDVRTGIPGGENNGTIAPGLLGPGALSWLGSVPMGPTGTIELELLGTAPGTEHDQLNLSADLLAAGDLVVTAPGLTASPGDRFAVLIFRSRVGNFDNVTLPPLSGIALDTVWAEGGTQDTLYLVASAAAPAPVKSWTNAAGGNWSTPANWSGGTVPTAADSVAIDLAGTYTVTLDVNAQVRNLTIGQGAGIKTLSGTSRTLTIDGSSAVYAGGALTLTNSTLAGNGTLTNLGTISLDGGTVSARLTNDGGVIRTTGTVSVPGAFRNFSGSTLSIGGLAGNSVFTVTNGFTNSGIIELTNVTLAYSAQLVITSGTLTNSATGTLRSLPGGGNGGARTLTATLNNQGTLFLDHPLTINGANAA